MEWGPFMLASLWSLNHCHGDGRVACSHVVETSHTRHSFLFTPAAGVPTPNRSPSPHPSCRRSSYFRSLGDAPENVH